ncbi:hypothetical protein MASR2M117_14340 [Paludibacter sp.]
MRKVVLSFLTLLSLSYLNAQFDAQLSQYMFNYSAFNPAAIGESNMLDVSGQHRINWVGMPNGGSTTVFNINSPFAIAGKKQAAGINFVIDEVGLFVNQLVHLQYAYQFKIGKGALKLAPQIGFVSVGFRGDSVRGPQVAVGDYHDIKSDPAIPTSMMEGVGFDLGFGVWYKLHNFYAGASYSHLNQPVVEWSDQHKFTPPSTLYVTGGYSKSLNNPKYILKPSMLFKTDFSAYQVDLSAIIEYNHQYWGGLTYRFGDAVVFLAGINIGNGLSLGYSFDLPVSQMIRASWSSHELMLSYQLNIASGDSSQRKKYKSIRIL